MSQIDRNDMSKAAFVKRLDLIIKELREVREQKARLEKARDSLTFVLLTWEDDHHEIPPEIYDPDRADE